MVSWYTPAGLWEQREQQRRPVNKLMQRLLRWIDYNTSEYVRHRTQGEYRLAVERLRQLRKLILLTNKLQTTGQSVMASSDEANLLLLQRHINRMLDAGPTDQYSETTAEPSEEVPKVQK